MSDFDDLLLANRSYASMFTGRGLEAPARARVAVVTCMDSRIDPLAMLGLGLGDAKVLRNPGGQVTDDVLEALVLAVHLLGVDRVMVVQHTRCAMASANVKELRRRVGESAGTSVTWMTFGAIADQQARLADDVAKVQTHPLLGSRAAVGGFIYDVDSGKLVQHA